MDKRYMYVSPSGTTYGPVYGKNEKQIRKTIRNFWGVKSTRGYYIYEETQSEADKKYEDKKEFYSEIFKANPQLCLTDFD